MDKHKSNVNGYAIRSKALELCDFMSREEGQGSRHDFQASKRWLHSFLNHFQLHDILRTGESASANTEAATGFRAQFVDIVQDGSYAPQVANGDETDLFTPELFNPSRATDDF